MLKMSKVASVSIAFGLLLGGLLSSCTPTTSSTASSTASPTTSPTSSTASPIASPIASPTTSSTASPQLSAQQEEPNQDNLTLTCRGTIADSVDYTAFFNRESGFNPVEFRPRTSTATLTATMTYSGKDAQGQNIRRGSVEDAADVVLVHLSTGAVQLGDQVAVGYDGRWGRATCR